MKITTSIYFSYPQQVVDIYTRSMKYLIGKSPLLFYTTLQEYATSKNGRYKGGKLDGCKCYNISRAQKVWPWHYRLVAHGYTQLWLIRLYALALYPSALYTYCPAPAPGGTRYSLTGCFSRRESRPQPGSPWPGNTL